MKRKVKMMDGNTAAAYVAYAYSEVAAIYPITPSTVMAELTDKWTNEDRKNIFGQPVMVTEMQSEAGVAGAVHGALAAGALTTSFTASQGLLLMIPNLYKIAGELLPCVIHVAARTVAAHALSIFGDHSDVLACRQTGFAMLVSSNVQEVMDLSPIAHCAALSGRIPFLNIFDGFRTSHEIQKIEAWDYDKLAEFMDKQALQKFRNHALNPCHPSERGSAQNPDIFFQTKEAANKYYNNLPQIVERYMKRINEEIGTNYSLFDYYGDPSATHIVIAMGSVCDTIQEVVEELCQKGEKAGYIKVHLYRPFSVRHLLQKIPDSVQKITVLDRTKEAGAPGEPLYLDIVAALKEAKREICLYSGRYGLASKDTTPGQIKAVFENTQKPRFTIGITDDVTNLSLKEEDYDIPSGAYCCKFYGLGSDGTVGANKNTVKIIGEQTDLYAQAYFEYDSKKSGGITISHLRFGKEKIHSAYLVTKADFVACHHTSYINKYEMVSSIRNGGIFLLNCPWEPEELEEKLPAKVKEQLAKRNIHFYIIHATQIGQEIGLGNRINTILQAAFFCLSKIIPIDTAVHFMKETAKQAYAKKGDDIVKMNYEAIHRGMEDVIEIKVPSGWAKAREEKEKGEVLRERNGKPELLKFVREIQEPVNRQEGGRIPVSAFLEYADGSMPSGSSAYEKRGIAIQVPEWKPENCIQCNLCSYVCPHACIRPVVMDEKEAKSAPSEMKMTKMLGMENYQVSMSVTVLDCTGCGSCASVCPGRQGNKALVMADFNTQRLQQKAYEYGQQLEEKPEVLKKFSETSVKGSQYKKPLLEYSGACAGCGETPYAKLVTQLFGDRMYIANATGCSSIWGNSAPSTPYTTDKNGHGPAWANSLFEDNAEFGMGMKLAQNAIRNRLKEKVKAIREWGREPELAQAAEKYLDTFEEGVANKEAVKSLVSLLEKSYYPQAEEILRERDFLSRKSQWIFGGDGWAYDIGFGGLDHVIASGEDVNILVFDTEVYSNTGGQASKATPAGAVAQFAAAGKGVGKKDLAAMAMSYGYVYVAQVSQGADYNQCVRAFVEAESYCGPSLIIAYAPCISHGIKNGMKSAQMEERRAVQSGYWYNFRFDPRKRKEGKAAFTLDSRKPELSYDEFIENELRFQILVRQNPDRAEKLSAVAGKDAKEKYEKLKRLEE